MKDKKDKQKEPEVHEDIENLMEDSTLVNESDLEDGGSMNESTKDEPDLTEMLEELRADNLQIAAEIAALVMAVRGFGHVKQRALDEVEVKIRAALEQYRNGDTQLAA